MKITVTLVFVWPFDESSTSLKRYRWAPQIPCTRRCRDEVLQAGCCFRQARQVLKTLRPLRGVPCERAGVTHRSVLVVTHRSGRINCYRRILNETLFLVLAIAVPAAFAASSTTVAAQSGS
jgi:hypothetical protein